MERHGKPASGVSLARIVTSLALALSAGYRVYGLLSRVGLGSLASGRSDAVALVVAILLNLVALVLVWTTGKWGSVFAALILLWILSGDMMFIMKRGLIGSSWEQTWTVIRLAAGGIGLGAAIVALFDGSRRQPA